MNKGGTGHPLENDQFNHRELLDLGNPPFTVSRSRDTTLKNREKTELDWAIQRVSGWLYCRR